MTTWKIDPAHSEVKFKVKHMMIASVTGHFDNFTARAETDGENMNNLDVEVDIEAKSVTTNNEKRDEHSKSEDFFNAGEYPRINFKSREFKGDKLIGDLTIKDNTREVELDVDFNGVAKGIHENTRAGFELSGDINRKDYDLNWNL